MAAEWLAEETRVHRGPLEQLEICQTALGMAVFSGDRAAVSVISRPT